MLNFIKKYVRSPFTRNFSQSICNTVDIYQTNISKTLEMNKDRLEKGLRTREPAMLYYFLRSFCQMEKTDFRPYKSCLHHVSSEIDKLYFENENEDKVKFLSREYYLSLKID